MSGWAERELGLLPMAVAEAAALGARRMLRKERVACPRGSRLSKEAAPSGATLGTPSGVA